MNETQTQSITFLTLVDWLGTEDPVLISRACEVLVKLNPIHLPRIVHEALNTKRSIRHRVRLLDVIEYMNHPLPPDSWIELMMATTKIKSPELRFKIAGLLTMHQKQACQKPTQSDCLSSHETPLAGTNDPTIQ